MRKFVTNIIDYVIDKLVAIRTWILPAPTTTKKDIISIVADEVPIVPKKIPEEHRAVAYMLVTKESYDPYEGSRDDEELPSDVVVKKTVEKEELIPINVSGSRNQGSDLSSHVEIMKKKHKAAGEPE